MARPKKPVDYTTELIRVDGQITKMKNTIKELENERKEIVIQQEQSQISIIYSLCNSTGITIGTLNELVQNHLVLNNSTI